METNIKNSDDELLMNTLLLEDGVEQEGYIPYPFDTEKISISSNPIPISTIVRRLKSNRIVAAEMQRDKDLWNDETKSKLIESILLKIPLPLFYASENKEGLLYVVDGLQRISAIRAYVADNSLVLQGLEFLKELEGKCYQDLSEDLQIRIDETNLQFAIISADSPPEIQRNIFKRLNTGGLPLSDQEIRHALYYGPATDLLKELAHMKEFHEATVKPLNDTRMEAQEFVLRFASFSMLGANAYKEDGEMDAFLCDTMQIINQLCLKKPFITMDSKKIRNVLYEDTQLLRKRFILAMKRSKLLFDKYAFRMCVPDDRRSLINKSLFEVWGVILSEISDTDFEKLKNKSETLFKRLSAKYREDNFRRCCGRDATKASGVIGRHNAIRAIVSEMLEGDSI